MTEAVTSLHLSVKLKDAGAPQDDLEYDHFLYWVDADYGPRPTKPGPHVACSEVVEEYAWDELARAFTAGELIELMKDVPFTIELNGKRGHPPFYVYTQRGSTYVSGVSDVSLADALSQLYLDILTKQTT